MKSRKLVRITAGILLAMLETPVQLFAQYNTPQSLPKRHHYQIIDMATLGGQASCFNYDATSFAWSNLGEAS